MVRSVTVGDHAVAVFKLSDKGVRESVSQRSVTWKKRRPVYRFASRYTSDTVPDVTRIRLDDHRCTGVDRSASAATAICQVNEMTCVAYPARNRCPTWLLPWQRCGHPYALGGGIEGW